MALRDDGLMLSSFECKIALLLFKESKIPSLKPPLLQLFSQELSSPFSLIFLSSSSSRMTTSFKIVLPLPSLLSLYLTLSTYAFPLSQHQDLTPPFHLPSLLPLSLLISAKKSSLTCPKSEVRWLGKESLKSIKYNCKWLKEEACASLVRRAPDH